jgi:hypothetical protein
MMTDVTRVSVGIVVPFNMASRPQERRARIAWLWSSSKEDLDFLIDAALEWDRNVLPPRDRA